MKPIYLRFDSQEQADKYLPAPDVQAGEAPPAWLLARDDIGTLYLPAADEKTPPEPLPGWHVNLMVSELPEELAAFAVVPHAPQRRFAGF